MYFPWTDQTHRAAVFQMSMHSPVQKTKVCSKRIVKLRRILLHELHAHALLQVQRTGQTSPLGEKYRYYRANRGTDVRLFVRNWVVCDTVVGRIVVPSSSFKRKVLRSTETSGKTVPNSTVFRSRRYWTAGTPLWGPQRSQSQTDRLLVTKLFFRYSVGSKQTKTLWHMKWTSDCWLIVRDNSNLSSTHRHTHTHAHTKIDQLFHVHSTLLWKHRTAG